MAFLVMAGACPIITILLEVPPRKPTSGLGNHSLLLCGAESLVPVVDAKSRRLVMNPTIPNSVQGFKELVRHGTTNEKKRLTLELSQKNYEYTLIPGRKKKDLLMFNKYTYSQHSSSSTYYCSQKYLGCTAALKLSHLGKVIIVRSDHTHDPPRYMKSGGKFIKLLSPENHMGYFLPERAMGCGMTCWQMPSCEYEFIPTLKGKNLLMYNQYTFSQDHNSNSYYCSKKLSGCRASVKLTKDGAIREANTTHNHSPPKYMKMANGLLIKDPRVKFIETVRGARLMMLNGFTFSQKNHKKRWFYCSRKTNKCQSRIRLNSDGSIICAPVGHNHPPPELKELSRTYEMIPTKKGKYLLMYQGYTYSQQHHTRNYYCSKKNSGCKARLKLDYDGKILSGFTEHFHPAPSYKYQFITSQMGKQLILIGGYTFSKTVTGNIWTSIPPKVM
ncbi:hypothetical protein HW555_009357 [Spodoptera exigua]|uniref:FLYWCH-type domain-containing protein n=1 Tax=Spodoptera exigua TaxID=7107 RepID=A0A835GAT0_SPOEX|nr:hypothetical protein HW555_009357 [Spodoptera exigua]